MAILDYYITVRSPYSYLSVPRVAELGAIPGIELRLRPVYPLAIRAPDFFKAGNPLLLNYLRRDAERVAEMQGHPFAWPDPDPVLQNLETSRIADDQPHVFFLTRLLAAAGSESAGFKFYQQLSALIFDGTSSWTAPGALAGAAESADLLFERLQHIVNQHAKDLDEALSENAKRLQDAGHWGTPSLAFNREIFFGQDRIAMCAWYLQKRGYATRATARKYLL